MIQSFANKLTEDVFHGVSSKRSLRFPKNLHRAARIRLDYLNKAKELSDLLVPPGNHFEELKGDRKGQYSIRINKQWRIVFQWVDGHAEAVEIMDYH